MPKKSTHDKSEYRPQKVATEAVEPNRAERGQRESEESFLAKKSVAFIAGILILFSLYLSSLYNYLLFHSLAEIFSIVVACGIFIVAWNSRRILDNNYLLFLGIAFLFIGALDLVHTLGYTGMGIFQGYGTNLPAQLWIATRYMESLSLLIAPLFLARRLRTDFVLMIYAVVTVLVLGSVFYWHIFPTCFVEGEGLTPFKKISEYIISIILIGAITVLFQKRKEFDERVFRLLVASIALTIASELAFTFYIHAYGFSNLVGHYLKIISFYLIYKAIIETGLVKPYDLLFRNLKQREESLRKEKDFSESLIDTAQVIILVLDIEGRIVRFNSYMEDLCGYKLDEVQGRDWFSTFLPEQDYDHMREVFRTAVSDIKTQGNINPIVAKDGREIITEWYDKTLKDAAGNTIGLLTIGQDITSRKQAEEALRKSEERFHTFIDFTHDWEFWIAPDGHHIYVSPSCERITGYGPEAFVNDRGLLEKIVHPDDHSTVVKHLGEEQSLEKLPLTDYRIITRSGEVRWMSHVCQAVYGADGTYLGRRGSNRDISRRKQMEEELQQSQKMEAIATLAGGVAHEFNNALMGILGNIELLKMDLPEDDRRDRYFEAMKDSGHRMSRLTDQLLAYAQGGKYQPKNLKLDDFMIQTLPILQHDLNSAVRVETHFQKDIAYTKADYAQMQMVLSAILANSDEAIEDEGLIRITAENKDIDEDFTKQCPGLKPGPYVCLTIADDGKGMDEETKDGIFEPFFTTKFQGRGMGMAAVYGIVINHDGWISVDSELGKGTTVRIYLPAIEIEVEKPQKAEVEVVRGSGTILMIEDEEMVIEVTQAMLEWLGYRVMVAKTGKDAIHITETFDGRIDLALLDIKLPDMEGGKVYPLIMQARPDLKVIVFSGYAIDGPARKILDAGAQDFIQKPFSLATLSEKLKEVLEGK